MQLENEEKLRVGKILQEEQNKKVIEAETREQERILGAEKRAEDLRQVKAGETLVTGEFERRQKEAADVRKFEREKPIKEEEVRAKRQAEIDKIQSEFSGLSKKRDLFVNIISETKEPTNELARLLADFKGVTQQGLKTQLAGIEGELEEKRLRLEKLGVVPMREQVDPKVQKLIDLFKK